MARNTKYKMQSLDIPDLVYLPLPGINVPQINYGVAMGGKDRPDNNATKGANWLADLTNIPVDLFQSLINTLDDISDGATYGKILFSDISDGHILLSSVEGNLDNVADGATYGKILLTGITAGKIVLTEVSGDLDDLADGSVHGKVLLTSLSAGKILLSEADGDLDDLDNGATYGKVALTNISAGNIVLKTNQNLGTQGIQIYTGTTGARVELLPDANTGLQVLDSDGNNVLKAVIGGTDIGDLIIGNYAGGQGILYDKSAGKTIYKGNIQASTITGSILSTGSVGANVNIETSRFTVRTGTTEVLYNELGSNGGALGFNDVDGNSVFEIRVDDNLTAHTIGFRAATTNSGNWVLDCKGNIIFVMPDNAQLYPNTDNKILLGNSSYAFNTVYAYNYVDRCNIYDDLDDIGILKSIVSDGKVDQYGHKKMDLSTLPEFLTNKRKDKKAETTFRDLGRFVDLLAGCIKKLDDRLEKLEAKNIK